ncbi:unnamed protein product [Mytilus coruscus]|uniref:Transcriptional coactivator p15 (PC4) C-terminal domain-containing protein n=1 Tax=Mytilus coruscus TaxID=42192 RepID=A0A6J8F075_MYTCO|nr:unnamed protein product [Mytilus coruscus]
MESACCNIEIGNQRFVSASEWKDEIRTDVREWETKNDWKVPTKTGISLPLQRWKPLTDNFEFSDQTLVEKRVYSTHLGGNVYCTVKANSVCIDMRQHWLPPNQTEVVPTKKGITLRPMKYTKLKDEAALIGDFVPELNSIVPCPYIPDHLNQVGLLKCSVCNPCHCADW